jgi:hypothetical protein
MGALDRKITERRATLSGSRTERFTLYAIYILGRHASCHGPAGYFFGDWSTVVFTKRTASMSLLGAIFFVFALALLEACCAE